MNDVQGPCYEFYKQRDDRTGTYLARSWRPSGVVRVFLGDVAAHTEVGQHLVLALTNFLARAHRHVLFSLPDDPAPLRTFSLVAADTIQEAVLRTARAIDPCGIFAPSKTGGDFTLGIGPEAETGLTWYLGADLANGYLQRTPTLLNTTARGSLRGAGIAAVLGAAAAFKAELDLPIAPRILSAWNYLEDVAADPGPRDLSPLDVGRVLMVGAGAVASGLVYWLRSWGTGGEWVVADGDSVKVHNTNRGMVFLPIHAGWPSGPELPKAPLIAEYLPRARPVENWYDEAKELRDERFDVVLALANERGVRSLLAHRNAPVLLHATTGRNWLSQLHRHIAGRDDCAACRLDDVNEVAFDCSASKIKTKDGDQVDAALPFLSGASALMLATALQRLQAGVLADGSANNWRWDLLSEFRMVAPPGRSTCLEACGSWYPHSVRMRFNAGTRWSFLDGAAQTTRQS